MLKCFSPRFRKRIPRADYVPSAVRLLARAVLLLLFVRSVAAVDPVPDKLVVLTFDDSVASHYTVVRPILKRHGFSATFFITEGFGFSTNKKDYILRSATILEII
jgi:peptidoglycan/xylan/chitin deacetylase (PgdA/CDA1 family)